MLRKILLCISTLGILGIAFAIYLWRQQPIVRPEPPVSTTRPHPVRVPVTGTQPSEDGRTALRYEWANIPAGQAPQVRVYDQHTGQARIAFQSRQWEPISDTEFHLVEPTARVLLPGGQLAYVRADEGQVRVQSGGDKNLIPQRGWFRGRVQIFIDRTSPEQRRENPRLAQPELHPEAVVKIWLDEARFDLDLDRLESDGPVLVQSAQGSIEGVGLRLMWSETDRRLQYLRVLKGKRAVIRGAGLSEAGPLPGAFEFVAEEQDASETDAPQSALPFHLAQESTEDVPAREKDSQPPAAPAVQKQKAQVVDRGAAGRPERIVLLDPDLPTPAPKKDRVDTYNVRFSGDVLARQREGIRVTGSLTADALTLLADFGREERDAVEYLPPDERAGSASRPASQPATQPAATQPRPEMDSDSTIELLWTGELVVTPEASPVREVADEAAPPDEAKPQKRFHLMAEGAPVRLADARRGTVTCGKLEYHLEARQGWLTASPGNPVVMAAGSDRQLIADEQLFFDQQAGLARIIGPGRLVRHPDEETAESALADAGTSPTDERSGLIGLSGMERASDVQIAWQRSGRFDFALSKGESAADSRDAPRRRAVYLSEASFEGQVRIELPERDVSADAIQVAFAPPELGPRPRDTEPGAGRDSLLDGPLVAEQIVATGGVNMESRMAESPSVLADRSRERFTCNRLEIDLTVDEAGANVPRQLRAYEDVIAWQEMQRYLGPVPAGPAHVREIRAEDDLTVDLDSVPRTYTDQQRAEFETVMRQRGLSPDSPEWTEYESAFLEKRDLVPTQLVARGEVFTRDTRQNLHALEGARLECTFTADNTIDRALIVAEGGRAAHVDHEDFEIRGRQIALEMATESVHVPGEGSLQFYTDQDLDGRRVDRPVPVAVTWDDQMRLRGRENTGTFQGHVRVISENNVLESNELRLRFAAEENPAHTSAGSAATLSRSLIRGVRGEGEAAPPSAPLERRMRRRLTLVDAFGDARILSSSYADEGARRTGRFAKAIRELVPDALRPPVEAPADDAAGTQPSQRLESRILLVGPLIRMDLVQEQLIVEGAGRLLIEDYRLPTGASERTRGRTSPFMSGSALPGMDGLGPSQTLFTWQRMMAFLNQENKATFHNDVTMRHRAGADMVLAGQLRAALQLDDAAVRQLRTQTATLTCRELVAQFERDPTAEEAGSSPLSRATRLRAFWARDDVMFVHREPTVERTAYGTFISYDNESGIARIEGTDARPNIIQEIDPATRQLRAQRQGGTLEWNLRTNVITAKGSVILAPGG